MIPMIDCKSLQAVPKPNFALKFCPRGLTTRTMETLVSTWASNVQTMPENYIFPPDKRPGKQHVAPPCRAIPVIDLAKAEEGDHDRISIIQQVLKASQEFGFFQVINHGVPLSLMDDTMSLANEFFDLPVEDRASVYSKVRNRRCMLYTSSFHYDNRKVQYWRDTLRHHCHPLEEYMQFWPEKPTRYRAVVGKYSVELRKLSSRILELICQGLGLEPGYLGDELSTEQELAVNYYPPCPDPSSALGLPKHCDPNLINILQQGDVSGLQLFKDGEWIGVEPVCNAFVVNIGHQLEVISNGKLRAAAHRAVTNSDKTRTTISNFFNPCDESIIEPAKGLVSGCNPPLYKPFKFQDFFAYYHEKGADSEAVMECYKLQA